MIRTPRGRLLLVLAVVLVVAGTGWGVGTLLRSPADEAAARKPPKPSLVTAAVERRKLVATVVVSGTLSKHNVVSAASYANDSTDFCLSIRNTEVDAQFWTADDVGMRAGDC